MKAATAKKSVATVTRAFRLCGWTRYAVLLCGYPGNNNFVALSYRSGRGPVAPKR